MGKLTYNSKIKEVLDGFLLNYPGTKAGKAFGLPGYYVKNKMFACVYEDGVSIKLPEPKVKKLLNEEGFSPFNPLGRAIMREWVYLKRDDPEDFFQDQDIFEMAIDFVSNIK